MPMKYCCCVFWLLWRSMGCLLSCLRTTDDNDNDDDDSNNRHRRSQPRTQSNISATGVPVQRNQLSSVLLSDEECEPLVMKDRENLTRRSGWSESENVDWELRDEAKFLKACGILPETPAEIRKLSRKLKESPTHNASTEPSKFHSFTNESIDGLLGEDKQLDESPDLTKCREEQGTDDGLHQDSSSSSPVINEESEISTSYSSPKISEVSCGEPVTSHQVKGTSNTAAFPLSSAFSVRKSQRHKSVRFNSELVLPESSPSQKVEKSELAGKQSVKRMSPCPTPLKLTDDMQTPGTVFASNSGHQTSKKNDRIRMQYVYTSSDPSENVSRINLLKQDAIRMPLALITEMDTSHQKENLTPNLEINAGQISANEKLMTDFSLVAKLKASPSFHGKKDYIEAAPLGSAVGGTNHGDKPILGLVDAHCKPEAELPGTSLVDDGGNETLNSTTNYEDQKVSWHAIPFDERLERALSEETVYVTQRWPMSRIPITFGKNDDDGAEPQLQSSSCPTVVSF